MSTSTIKKEIPLTIKTLAMGARQKVDIIPLSTSRQAYLVWCSWNNAMVMGLVSADILNGTAVWNGLTPNVGSVSVSINDGKVSINLARNSYDTIVVMSSGPFDLAY